MTTSVAGNVKGTVISARLSFIQSELGAAALERILGRLPPADRDTLRGIIVPMAWMPFALCERLNAAISFECPDDVGLFRRLGERSARDNLASFHRVYLRDGDPHAMLMDAPTIYRLYYDTGRREYERVSDCEAVLRTIDSLTFSINDCETVVGWYQTAIGLCGGRDARVEEIRCRARDDAVCEYRCTWGRP